MSTQRDWYVMNIVKFDKFTWYENNKFRINMLTCRLIIGLPVKNLLTSHVIMGSPVKNTIRYRLPDFDMRDDNFLLDLLTQHEPTRPINKSVCY